MVYSMVSEKSRVNSERNKCRLCNQVSRFTILKTKMYKEIGPQDRES